ncbi:MAG: hypothetical protein OXI95_02580 [bacterium]|nr:hypothetical protein [bacterium]MDE0415811.1 hypothetical protein [bacterium]
MRTGEPVAIEASTTPTFKPARSPCEAVNAGSPREPGRASGTEVRHVLLSKSVPHAQGP